MTRAAAALALVAAAAAPAAADPLDDFGFGEAGAAEAGARAALAEGAEAAHTNPAGVALGDDPSVMLGWGYDAMALSIDGNDADVLDPHGTSLGIAVPVDLGGGWKVGGGAAMYLPDQFLARIQLIPATEPHFVLLDNDPHRIAIEPVVAVSYRDKLAIGAGASLLADARSKSIVFDVGVVGGEKVGQAQIDLDLPIRKAPMLGVWARPIPRLRAAAVYRGELSLDLALDILANVQVVGVVTGDALISLRTQNYFTPARVTGGLAFDVTDAVTVSGDVTWSQWSRYAAGVADLAVLVALDITPPLVSTAVPAPAFTDTVNARLGAEYRHAPAGARTTWAVRGGWAWLPSPVPDQTGLTSFADGARMLVTAGVGLTLADWRPTLTKPISLDLGLQWQHVQHRLTQKDIAQFPGQAYSSGGDLFHAGVSATVRF